MTLNLDISDDGVALLSTDEGFAAVPYMDRAAGQDGFWTVGFGHVIHSPDGKELFGAADAAAVEALFPAPITKEQALELLHEELKPFVKDVNAIAAPDTTQAQFDALVLFAYNEGLSALSSSTLLKLHNAGKRNSGMTDEQVIAYIVQGNNNPDYADQAFFQWVYERIDGKLTFVKGLQNRRQSERDAYVAPALFHHPGTTAPAPIPAPIPAEKFTTAASLWKDVTGWWT